MRFFKLLRAQLQRTGNVSMLDEITKSTWGNVQSVHKWLLLAYSQEIHFTWL